MGKRISEMTPATALNSNDIVPIVDTGGNNRTITGNQIKNFVAENNTFQFVGDATGTTAITLPDNWNELLVYMRYGNANGLQQQTTQCMLIPAIRGLTMTAGGGTIIAQCFLSAMGASVNMVYFGVGDTNYTATSHIYVYYR